MTVLIFRPTDKITQTICEFEDAGISAVGVPLIENQALPEEIEKLNDIFGGGHHDKVIFVSTTASQLTSNYLTSYPDTLSYFAVGKSTAEILLKSGIKVITPSEESSEGLLALPDFQDVSGKSIIIIKGQGGRQTLTEVLEQRGAQVSEVPIYRRSTISRPNATKDWNAEDINCIIATSGELVSAAFEQFETRWLQAIPWIVVSQRVEILAREKGVQTVFTSKGAQSEKLIAATIRFLEQ